MALWLYMILVCISSSGISYRSDGFTEIAWFVCCLVIMNLRWEVLMFGGMEMGGGGNKDQT